MSLDRLYAREELESEWSANADYLAELRAEHADPWWDDLYDDGSDESADAEAERDLEEEDLLDNDY